MRGGARAAAAWTAVAAAGAVVGTTCDHLHVLCGVLRYPRPAFLGEAWWVPLLFAGAAVAGVVSLRPFPPVAPRVVASGPVAQVVLDAALLVAAWATTALLADRPTALLIGLAAVWAARVVGRGAAPLALGLAAAALGCGFEAAWSRLGLFHYARPDLAGVPRWLPALYLHASLAVAAIARVMPARGAAAAAAAVTAG